MRGGTLLAILFIISLSAGAFLFQDFQPTGKAILCTSNWSCSDWSPCANKEKIRTCIDTNICGNPSGKPSEITTCDADCIPDWSCSLEWIPEECPESGIQTKDCIDQNNCATPINMPESARECEYRGTYEWLFYTIIVINILTIVLVLVLLFSLFYKLKKHSKRTNDIEREERYKSFAQKENSQPSNFDTPTEIPRLQNAQMAELPQQIPTIPAQIPPSISQNLKSENKKTVYSPQTQPIQPEKLQPHLPLYRNSSLPSQNTQTSNQTRQQSINELMPKSNSPANFKKNKKQ